MADESTPVDRADPTTVRITRLIRPGREREYERLVRQWLREAEAEIPGFREGRVFPPPRGSREYRVVLRFDSAESAAGWEHSELKARIQEATADLAESAPQFANITGTTQEGKLALALTPLERFVQTTVSGIGLLIAGTVAAIILANSPFSDEYEAFWNLHLTIGVEQFGITETLRHWVNDALMALFFFIVGLEIKREVLVGEMRYPRQAALAIAAAVGGVVVPALIFAGINLGGEGFHGWGIPIGTDTAFALGILALLGTRVRPILLVFVTAFAIIDDILAVGVIAVFYTDTINWLALGLGLVLLAVLAAANAAGFHRWPIYAVLGVAVWVAIFESGVHGTIAGVLVAMTVPARSWINPSEFLTRARQEIDNFEAACFLAPSILTNEPQQQATYALSRLVEDVETPMTYFQHRLNPLVAYAILPIFAFANAGIPLVSGLGDAISSSVSWGVALGLIIGKPLGITLFAWAAARTGLARLPRALTMRHIFAVGWVGGIGFTISLFVTELAFRASHLADLARVGILFGSLVAGSIGFLLLRASLPPPLPEEAA